MTVYQVLLWDDREEDYIWLDFANNQFTPVYDDTCYTTDLATAVKFYEDAKNALPWEEIELSEVWL